MENTKPIKIKADIMWACLDKPNDMSGKYQVDLCNLSDNAVDALQDMGITARQKEDKGFFITCKSTNPIRAYDRDGDALSGISIGNGSKGVALIGSYSWTFKNKEGVSPSLKKLVVDELVKYESEEGVMEQLDDDDEIL
jgi:hypothetical protein